MTWSSVGLGQEEDDREGIDRARADVAEDEAERLYDSFYRGNFVRHKLDEV